MNQTQDYRVETSTDVKQVPKRIAFIKKTIPARFEQEKEEERLVMSFPHLVIREVISFELTVIILVVIALLFDAPLEELANPEHTPNPAKAPWYFVGLQELLHYFPPVVAGVLLPLLVIVALIVIPYFEINIKREGLWKTERGKTFYVLTAVVGTFTLVMAWFQAYPIVVPTILMYALMLIPYLYKVSPEQDGFIGWLSRRSLAEWIMAWFVIVAAVLTLIGSLFRGPGWNWTWPWEGIY